VVFRNKRRTKADDGERDCERDVLVARVPVLDPAGLIAGYRIAYGLPGGGTPPPVVGRRAISLFDAALSVVSLRWLAGDTPVYMPVSRDLLFELGLPPGRRDRMVLRIAHADVAEPEVASLLRDAVTKGYALELDDLTSIEPHDDLLELFSVVEIDFRRWSVSEIQVLASTVASRGAVPLAAGVRDQAEWELARSLGCRLLTGEYCGGPGLARGRQIPAGNVQTLSSILRLQSPEVAFEDVVELVTRDVGLTLRLLRYVNSAYFGTPAAISSIRDAALRIGSRGVARWALTISLVGAPGMPREVALIALTRGRLCELLGAGTEVDPGELFTIGLLSTADLLLGAPIDRLAAELPLSTTTTLALTHHHGTAGAVLEATLAYERGDLWEPQLERFGAGHGDSYRSALTWAEETLAHAA
jgi:EAL and modified HD-GYP domain-containing signal transduction protein